MDFLNISLFKQKFTSISILRMIRFLNKQLLWDLFRMKTMNGHFVFYVLESYFRLLKSTAGLRQLYHILRNLFASLIYPIKLIITQKISFGNQILGRLVLISIYFMFCTISYFLLKTT